MKFEKVKEKFTKYGDSFTQLIREGNFCIYERATSNGRIQYEVIILRVLKACVAFGKEYPAKEGYPTSSQWGNLGWTLVSLDRAKAKMLDEQSKRGLLVVKSVRKRKRRK